MKVFRDRAAAGAALAQLLREYASRPDAIVLALPRGGVPVVRAPRRSLLCNLFLCAGLFHVSAEGAPLP